MHLPRKIVPVLLCGGSGTRLWPLSRKSYPKQFSPLLGPESLFQASARRLAEPQFTPPLVVTSNAHRFTVLDQLEEVGIAAADVLIEPDGRDTAPAILAAALHIAARDPEAVMLVAPSDHAIPDFDLFLDGIDAAQAAVEDGQLITFGIVPDRPETGYGYLELPKDADPNSAVIPLKSFVEKPEKAAAEDMLARGNFLWNSGIFLFSAKAIEAAFSNHVPDLLTLTKNAVSSAKRDLSFIRLDPDAWRRITPISIDYAVMEKARNLSVVPFAGRWSDLGDWTAVWRETETNGIATSGAALALDCANVLLRAEAEGQTVVGIGLENIVAVAMPDAVLIAHKDRAQDVKQAVAELKASAAPQAETFPKDHRPWGFFESLATGERFQVKRIVVQPGAALSLQSHTHRAEHWIVVQGQAKVTLDGAVTVIGENQSTYIPQGATHRLENPGDGPCVLIEVQTGSYLGEDDIVRYDDVYGRRTPD